MEEHQGSSRGKLQGGGNGNTNTNTGDARAPFVPEGPATSLDSSSKNYNKRREGALQDQGDRRIVRNLNLTSSNTIRRLQRVSS